MLNTSQFRERFLLSIVLFILAVIVAYPLSKIIIQSFKYDQIFSLQNYINVFFKNGTYTEPMGL